MIGWAPRMGYDRLLGREWHLSDHVSGVSLCGIAVAGIGRYVKRDPHKVDHHKGVRCPTCWREWGLLTGASFAAQHQDEAASTGKATPWTRRQDQALYGASFEMADGTRLDPRKAT